MRSDGTLWSYYSGAPVEVVTQAGSTTPFYASSFSASSSAYFTTGAANSNSSGLACAVDTSGNGYVYCWGSNTYGAVGNAATPTSSGSSSYPVANYPVQVVTNPLGGPSNPQYYLQNITQVFVEPTYGYNACAIDTGGNVWCWGYNGYGVLGQGQASSGNTWSPYALEITGTADGGTFSGVATMSLSYYNACALVTGGADAAAGGQVWCWGYNYYGDVGTGSASSTTVWGPTAPVSGLLGTAVDVTVSNQTACSATTSGNVYCWGYNGSGQLGIGTTGGSTPTQLTAPSAATPVLLASSSTALSGITQVAGVSNGMCALQGSNGDIYCWGSGDYYTAGSSSYNEGMAVPYSEGTRVTNVFDFGRNGESYPSFIDYDGKFHYEGSSPQTQVACPQ
jgi:alpha-tubulin suppressor-like RCC1 family protein